MEQNLNTMNNPNMNNNYTNDEIEIDLMEIIMLLVHWLWVIVLAAAIGGAIMFCYSKFFITPTYESTTRIVVLNTGDNDELTYNDMQLGTQLTNDYSELITSRYVIESVMETFALDTTYESFKKKIEVSTPSNTRIIDITLTDTDPLLAKEMVDELRDVAAERIKEVMAIEAVNLVDEGNIPTHKAAPSISKYTMIGILAGGFLSVAVILVLFFMDDTIKSSEDIEKYLRLSTLGLIPIIETEEERKKRKRHHHKQSKEEAQEEKEARSRTKKMVVLDLNDEEKPVQKAEKKSENKPQDK